MRPTPDAFAGGDEAFLALARAHHARCPASRTRPRCSASDPDAVVAEGLGVPWWDWDGPLDDGR